MGENNSGGQDGALYGERLSTPVEVVDAGTQFGNLVRCAENQANPLHRIGARRAQGMHCEFPAWPPN